MKTLYLILALVVFCAWVENYDTLNDFIARALIEGCRGPMVIYWGQVHEPTKGDDDE